MGVPINNVTRRVVYAASGTGPYNFTFEILAAADIAVYRDDSLLTLTTDYSVTINSNGTGFVTLTATPTGATQIAIVGNRTIQRVTDFVTGGDFFANTLNDELDQQTIFNQQNSEALQRALVAPQTDPTTINMTLPRASLRANKTLGFDSNGNPTLGETLGTNRGNWASGTLYYVRDIVKDTSNNNIWQCLTQHTSTGSQPINTNTDSAKWTLLVDAASATTSATNAAASASAAATSASNASSSASAASTSASNASTSASNASTSATNAASSASAASSSASSAASSAASAAASLDSFDDRYLGSKSSDPTLDNDGNALVTGALYYRTTAPIGMKVYDGAQWIEASAAQQAALVTYEYVATAGQTTFTGADANSLTLSYIAGGLIVSLNGVILRPGDDYTATNGTSVVLSAAAALNDELNIYAFSSFNVANVYTQSQSDLRYAQTAAANTFTATQTFNGSTSTLAMVLADAAETTTISATAATGTIAYDVTTQSVLYYTSNASANWTVNFRGSSGTSMNSLISTGQSVTVTFLVTQGSTPYFNNAVQVDGSSVTPRYQGGTAWSAGNASSIDAYTYTIVKTGNAAFTVFAAQTRFA
jgi:hypothetical protein